MVGKNFTVGDEVLVFFPLRKIEKSPKLMNFCYGHYVIEEDTQILHTKYERKIPKRPL